MDMMVHGMYTFTLLDVGSVMAMIVCYLIYFYTYAISDIQIFHQ
jgi:hypothetical protein